MTTPAQQLIEQSRITEKNPFGGLRAIHKEESCFREALAVALEALKATQQNLQKIAENKNLNNTGTNHFAQVIYESNEEDLIKINEICKPGLEK